MQWRWKQHLPLIQRLTNLLFTHQQSKLKNIGLLILLSTPNGPLVRGISGVDFYSCVVFAQMYLHGDNKGIHCFLVRIRNEDMSICKGVRIEDMGKKYKKFESGIFRR